ncbi:hypothetical protein AMAG_03373 [Allomyces macrogynus ATCC 38327]|uniref:Uncharacterized protein n=1 Tax=Allomyces macrogynus (strain ATCC 38327) TaxID=578462 RepID=A0A0L0S8X5_ALLM3|nr:hypothetical protein AMAG_03373 [Allomyces macrogynus ATCC 38327]|eukprot:KNE59023.1 hypothetical protein AMAG_03373 [Allomyces macrogynus ATCC 38327]
MPISTAGPSAFVSHNTAAAFMAAGLAVPTPHHRRSATVPTSRQASTTGSRSAPSAGNANSASSLSATAGSPTPRAHLFNIKLGKLHGSESTSAFRHFVAAASPAAVALDLAIAEGSCDPNHDHGLAPPVTVLKTSFRSASLRHQDVDPWVGVPNRAAVVVIPDSAVRAATREASNSSSSANSFSPRSLLSASLLIDPEFPLECLATPPPRYDARHRDVDVSDLSDSDQTSLCEATVAMHLTSPPKYHARTPSGPLPKTPRSSSSSDRPVSTDPFALGIVRLTTLHIDGHAEIEHHVQFSDADETVTPRTRLAEYPGVFERVVRAAALALRKKFSTGPSDPMGHQLLVHVRADDLPRRLALKSLGLAIATEYADPRGAADVTWFVYAIDLETFFDEQQRV